MTHASTSAIRVSTPSRAYDVVVGEGVLATVGDRLAQILKHRTRAFVVSDDNLPDEPLDEVLDALSGAGFDIAEAVVTATESTKSVETVERLLTDIARTRHERGDPIVALGGGVVGDVVGFTAAVYKRGAPVVQCPTTLLAMVDAAVGGKTGVNLPTPSGLKKNLVGAVWQPCLVLADVATLDSLPDRHLRAGLAECLKHGLIAETVGVEPGLFAWTVERLAAFLGRDRAALTELVRRNVSVKARVVEQDEREEAPSDAGGRALLNLGHTFAHAIEPIRGLSPTGDIADAPLLHGEAVGLGLIAAAAAAVQFAILPAADLDRIRAAVGAAGLPTRIVGLPPDDRLIETMSHDKKVAQGRQRLILPQGVGRARVVDDPPAEVVLAGLAAIRG